MKSINHIFIINVFETLSTNIWKTNTSSCSASLI